MPSSPHDPAAYARSVGLDPAALSGSVVVVPVLRVGGRLAPAGASTTPLRFPGDAAGKRAARDAFAIFSDVVVGAHALIVLGGPRRGRRGVVVARGRLDDPRVRRLTAQVGATGVRAKSTMRSASHCHTAVWVPLP